MSNTDKQELSPGAKIVWGFLGSLVGVILAILAAGWLLSVGLDSAKVFGLRDTDFWDAVGLVIGVMGVSWAWRMGQPTSNAGSTNVVVAKSL